MRALCGVPELGEELSGAQPAETLVWRDEIADVGGEGDGAGEVDGSEAGVAADVEGCESWERGEEGG